MCRARRSATRLRHDHSPRIEERSGRAVASARSTPRSRGSPKSCTFRISDPRPVQGGRPTSTSPHATGKRARAVHHDVDADAAGRAGGNKTLEHEPPARRMAAPAAQRRRRPPVPARRSPRRVRRHRARRRPTRGAPMVLAAGPHLDRPAPGRTPPGGAAILHGGPSRPLRPPPVALVTGGHGRRNRDPGARHRRQHRRLQRRRRGAAPAAAVSRA